MLAFEKVQLKAFNATSHVDNILNTLNKRRQFVFGNKAHSKPTTKRFDS